MGTSRVACMSVPLLTRICACHLRAGPGPAPVTCLLALLVSLACQSFSCHMLVCPSGYSDFYVTSI